LSKVLNQLRSNRIVLLIIILFNLRKWDFNFLQILNMINYQILNFIKINRINTLNIHHYSRISFFNVKCDIKSPEFINFRNELLRPWNLKSKFEWLDNFRLKKLGYVNIHCFECKLIFHKIYNIASNQIYELFAWMNFNTDSFWIFLIKI